VILKNIHTFFEIPANSFENWASAIQKSLGKSTLIALFVCANIFVDSLWLFLAERN
jgi:hypothetical protein